MPGEVYRYLLRIPEELRQKLAESAAKQGRSFNAEVGHRLAQSFEPRRSRLQTSIRGKGREMDFSILRRRPRWVITGAVVAASIAVVASTALGVVGGDEPSYPAGSKPKVVSEFGRAPLTEAGSSAELLARNAFFMSRRTAGTYPLDADQAGIQRAQGQAEAKALRKGTSSDGPTTFESTWAGLGPNPIVQVLRSPGGPRFGAMSGRIGALAIRKDGTILLAGAQGGIWKWTGDPATGVGSWTALTDGAVSLAMGALAVAPSNDNIVYGGTGEGHLSGDSYFGNG
ncbi:MAG TPA: Arc family DNA-binding protein, partial [Gaiellaceae bacterium]|nr:Arc family DNA-binding protein [Gaiellaceae bacterium]